MRCFCSEVFAATPGLPSWCDGFGESFILQLGFDCPKDGYRYNESRDCLGDLAVLVWPQVIGEPMAREGDPTSDNHGLHLDVGVRGVWQP